MFCQILFNILFVWSMFGLESVGTVTFYKTLEYSFNASSIFANNFDPIHQVTLQPLLSSKQQTFPNSGRSYRSLHLLSPSSSSSSSSSLSSRIVPSQQSNHSETSNLAPASLGQDQVNLTKFESLPDLQSSDVSSTNSPNRPTKYNRTNPFSVRIVGIFVADSELPYTLELAKPSIDIAIEKAKTLYPITKWEDAVFRNGSSRCTSNFAGVFAAEEFYLRRVTVFIGPSCGLALDPVARMAAHWRIPVISSGGPHVQFSNKDIFSTLTRLSFSLTNLGSFVSQVFHLFNWTHVSVIVHELPSSPLIPLIKETIVDTFDSESEIMLEMHEISRSLAKTNLKNLLVECAKESRIILVLTSGETLRQILLAGYELGMSNGGYVFITVELFKHENSFGNFDWFIAGDSRNEDIKKMYESLFIVTVHVPMTDTYTQFADDVIKKSRNEFNTSFWVKDDNVILAGFHDSVILYGKAVTDTIEAGGDPMDGFEVTKRIWNQTFTNYLSGDIYINANGDKETDYTLKDFNSDSLEMRSVINYSGREDKIIWVNLSAIHWPRNWIPSSDVNLCHSEIVDLYCNKSSKIVPMIDILFAVITLLVIIIVVVFFVYRKLRLESELTSLWWKIRWNEIIFIHNQSDRSLDASKALYSTFVASTGGEPIGTNTVSIGQIIDGQHSTVTTFGGSGGVDVDVPPPAVGTHLELDVQPEDSGSSPKSNSAPQTISHNFIARYRQKGTLFGGPGEAAATNTANSSTNLGLSKTKPHIRINDYFALPSYLQQLSVYRTNRSSNFFAKSVETGSDSIRSATVSGIETNLGTLKCTSSGTSPSNLPTTMLSVARTNTNNNNPHGNLSSMLSHGGDHQKQISSESLAQFPNKGVYKGSKVFIKHLFIKHFTVNRELLLELKQLKDLAHENLIRFVGICAEDQHISILTEYCEKGNLRDLLDNEGIRIDWPFRYSLINDIVEGMLFIHESSLSYLGTLKSTNCVIDSRLVVKLTDFGLKTLRNLSRQNSGPTNYKNLLWTAPEHLRQRKPELHGSQKGDVYSFSIVLQEIITRSGPFETVKVVGGDGKYSVVSLDPQFIIQQLKLGGSTPYRPNVDQRECLPELIELLAQCWDENPYNRPSFSIIRSQIRKIAKDFVGGSGNSFLENLLLRLEQYANDLEILVEQKTSAFFEEKRKCEELLYELLPRTVADQLKRGNQVKPESYQCVTIFFSDIVQFTQISAASTPIEIVDFLNDLYTLFDSIIASYDVYKVETVGDAYMVVSGLPVRNGNEHTRQIARMSLELLYRIRQFQIKHLPDHGVKMRIGIHSGPCAAGVIGLKMPRYCLFGDTVNTASRMESHGEPNKIHISEAAKHILEKFGTFHLTLRGDIYLKGKGIVRTYWLEKEQNHLINRYRFLNKKLEDNAYDQTYHHQNQHQNQNQQQLTPSAIYSQQSTKHVEYDSQSENLAGEDLHNIDNDQLPDGADYYVEQDTGNECRDCKAVSESDGSDIYLATQMGCSAATTTTSTSLITAIATSNCPNRDQSPRASQISLSMGVNHSRASAFAPSSSNCLSALGHLSRSRTSSLQDSDIVIVDNSGKSEHAHQRRHQEIGNFGTP